MSSTLPYQGHFRGPKHHFAQRVYFEDTDFSGVVYHARYLHFMERARSDMVARAAIDQRAAHEAGKGAYAVTAMTLKFRRPAHFDDALLVTTWVDTLRGASVEMKQEITRGDELLLTADVTAAFISPGGRPLRQPKEWVAAFQTIMNNQARQE